MSACKKIINKTVTIFPARSLCGRRLCEKLGVSSLHLECHDVHNLGRKSLSEITEYCNSGGIGPESGLKECALTKLS